jgi:predicted nucleic acid-binding protein
MSALRKLVEEELLPALRVESRVPTERVVVVHLPEPWCRVGTGNYAAVLAHPEHPEWVVKVYAPGRTGADEEKEVYRILGEHPAYSRCLLAGDGYLVLRRLHGVTLFEALRRGLPIPERVIEDVDDALEYASRRGLRPHDVHARNLMMKDGRGLVVDVSDFLQEDPCSHWPDLKRAYYWIHRPVFMRLGIPVPRRVLNLARAAHRAWRGVVPARSS